VDDSLIFDTKVFTTEEEARNTDAPGYEFIASYRVVLPRQPQTEVEELEGSDEVDAPAYVYVNGRNVRVGDTVTVSRSGYGYREAVVKKLRNDPKRQLFVQANDGTGPYWALNRNVR
jgi:hypothetical protein